MNKMMVLALSATFAAAAELPLIRPEIRAQNGASSVGVTVDVLALTRARRPTKTVYVEEAVTLWRPAPGQMIASTAGGQADITAAVDVRQEERPMGVGEVAADHFRRNAGKYVASALAAAVAGGAWAIYENNKSDSKPAAPAPPVQNTPRNSPEIHVTTGDNSPVDITMPITAMPPE